jgi:Fanconi anemia group M protein
MHIAVDFRETASGIADNLYCQGVAVEFKHLEYGDYLINDTVTIERKTGKDFLVSIIDGRLFNQIAVLKRKCSKPLVLIEGNQIGRAHV